MELFGILFSIPVAFVMSMVYCAILAHTIRQYALLRGLLYTSSLIVLFIFVCEVVLLATLGTVDSRALVGPSFYVAHLISFVLGTPALANVLLLCSQGPFLRCWYLAGVVCAFFAFGLVLLQYSVFEALYVIDGTNGPYS
jgi:hypothetical protein